MEYSSMEITPTSCRELPEVHGILEDPNYLLNQYNWHMNSVVDELEILPPLPIASGSSGEINYSQNSFSVSNNCLSDHRAAAINRPSKHLKTNHYSTSWNVNSCKTTDDDIVAFSPKFNFPFATPNNHIINPMAINAKPQEAEAAAFSRRCTESDIFGSQNNYVLKGFHGHGVKRVSTSSGNRFSQARDHIMAERNRREKLSQKFITLSALLPGLKKMDKASVLGEAVKHIEQLQERVKKLEDQLARNKSMESVVSVKKSQLLSDHIDEFSFNEPLPEIEARFCDRSALIRIHCEKRKGFPTKIMSEIEKINHLTVINSNFITFGTSALDITVVAQMDMEFQMTVKDLVKKLRAAI